MYVFNVETDVHFVVKQYINNTHYVLYEILLYNSAKSEMDVNELNRKLDQTVVTPHVRMHKLTTDTAFCAVSIQFHLGTKFATRII